MLVLTRKTNERIMIGDSIVITVIEIRGNQVRLGIEAPKDVPVHRREVYDAIKRASHLPELQPRIVTLPKKRLPQFGALIMLRKFLLVIAALVTAPAGRLQADDSYDVVVYGGTSGGLYFV